MPLSSLVEGPSMKQIITAKLKLITTPEQHHGIERRISSASLSGRCNGIS